MVMNQKTGKPKAGVAVCQTDEAANAAGLRLRGVQGAGCERKGIEPGCDIA